MNATSEVQDDTLLTVPEVAARLRVSKNHVYDMLRRGELAGCRVGRRRLAVFKDSVQAILDAARRGRVAK